MNILNTDLNALSKQVHETAKSKGFWDQERNMGELFMLMISELSEGLEAHRTGRTCNVTDWEKWEQQYGNDEVFAYNFKTDVKDTFEDEIADTFIRVLDYIGYRDYDIDGVLGTKDFIGFIETTKEELSYDNVGETMLSLTILIANGFVKYKMDEPDSEELVCALVIMQHLADAHNFDLQKHIELKLKFNATRERLHGKKY